MASAVADTEALVSYLVKSLVESPDSVHIDKSENDGVTRFELTLDPDDVGKIIGRQGRIIKAIRTLARAAGSTAGIEVEVDVIG